MRVKIKPGRASGAVTAPASKSMAHRMLICAALAGGVSRVHGVSDCEDVRATLDCMHALGIKTETDGDTLTVHGIDHKALLPKRALECRESGSTLRFLIPLALLTGKTVMFSGAKSLMSRPMTVYEQLCRERGLDYISDGESITVKGPLRGGDFHVVGNISSQFISGLLFALPLMKKDSRIIIAPPVESRSYIEMTIRALKIFGVEAVWEDEFTILVRGGQSYLPADVTVEGDWSGSAFIDALGLLGGSVRVDGLDPESIQGDRVYRKYFEMLERGLPTLHIGNCPDLGPILFAVAAAKNGGIFSGTKRLKIKESDRAQAMADELAKFGTSVTVYDDKVVVYPLALHAPTEPLNGHNDHRIVMSLAVLATVTGGEIVGAEAIAKSYPAFFDHLESLGIEVERYDEN